MEPLLIFTMIMGIFVYKDHDKVYPHWNLINQSQEALEIDCSGVTLNKPKKLNISSMTLYPQKRMKFKWDKEYTVGKKLRGAKWNCYSGKNHIEFETLDEEELTLLVDKFEIKVVRDK
jgi:hypothetical protein